MKKPAFTKALIVGASSDMARSFAQILAKNKIDVVLAGRNLNELEADAANLQIRYGIDAKTMLLDITNDKGRTDGVKALQAKHKDVSLVAVFAGYLGDQKKAQTDTAESVKIIESNYTGAVLFLELAASYLTKQTGRRAIVGVSSVAGDRGRQSNYLYGSAKAGFTAYLSGLRNRLHHEGIPVLTVKPGFVKTAMTKDLDLPPVITATADQAAADIYKAVLKKKNVIYTLWMWRYIMMIIGCIPEAVFKKLKL